tara:strand:+ start:1404 stop:1604 length:201 start_codon:yes stop_codon:yes gene_type:complete
MTVELSELAEVLKEMDLDAIPLDDLLVAVGSVLFTGTTVSELDTTLLNRLSFLVDQEIHKREGVLH